MADTLGRLTIARRTGREPFHRAGQPLGFDVLGFWQWSASDLVSNAARGVLAEYLVAKAVGVDTARVRDGWASYDLQTPAGVRIEVKSAAYLQSWRQAKPSAILFSTRPVRAWDPETNELAAEPRRHADVYVFALHAHRDKATLDPLDVAQWRFYVLPTRVLNERTRSQHLITLRSLEALAGEAVPFEGLREAVERVAADGASLGGGNEGGAEV
jgi:hypothetical protein